MRATRESKSHVSTTNGLGCSGGTSARARRERAPYFAAVSQHLFVPNAIASTRANNVSVRVSSEAVVGVHVRSTILLALHKDKRDAACGKSKGTCEQLLRTYGFLDCLAKVRNASMRGGYQTSRVYVAADNAMVRAEATQVLGDGLLPTPPYLYAGRARCEARW